MSSEIQELESKITEEFHRKIPFDPHKNQNVSRIIAEAPQEISDIISDFKAHGMNKVVESEDDFLLGCVISFIFYKFKLYCVLEGNAIREDEIPVFQSQLFAGAARLRELITKIKGA